MKQKLIALAIFILAVVLILFLLFGPQTPKQNNSIFDNTTNHYLTNEDIRVNLPNCFKRSSRYRLKEDIPFLKSDSATLRFVEDELMALEFEDRDVDVYVDTTLDYRFIVICNIDKILFSNNDAAILKRTIKMQNQKMAERNPSLNFGIVEATINNNSDLIMARFTTPVANIFQNTSVYNSVYFVTGDVHTLVVYEFSESEAKVEDFLWTCTI